MRSCRLRMWGKRCGASRVWLMAVLLGMLPGSGPAFAQAGFDSIFRQIEKERQEQRQRQAPQRPLLASTPHQRSEIVQRDVLALFDGSQEPSPDRTRIHRFLELPLNHLGLKVKYWNLRDGLPDADLVKRHRAVVTWFGERIPEHRAYLEWAAKLAAAGTRFVVLEFTGAPLGPDDLPAVNAFTRHIGIEFRPRWIGPSEAGTIVTRDDQMLDFESKLGAELPGYMLMDLRPGPFKAHLTLESKPNVAQPAEKSTAVVTGPGGGFAAVGYVRHYDPQRGRMSWTINPFSFLTAALGPRAHADPDVTTISGRRLYFSHIDGDGWMNLSHDPARRGQPSAEIVASELIEAYPDLPVTVGLIASDATPGTHAARRAADIAPPPVRAAARRGGEPHPHASIPLVVLRGLRPRARAGPRRGPPHAVHAARAAQHRRRRQARHPPVLRDRRPRLPGRRQLHAARHGPPRVLDRHRGQGPRSTCRNRWRRPTRRSRSTCGAGIRGRSTRRWRRPAPTASGTSTAATAGSTAISPRSCTCRRSAGRSARSARSTPSTATRTPIPTSGAAPSTARRSCARRGPTPISRAA